MLQLTLFELGEIIPDEHDTHPVGFRSKIKLRDSTWEQRIKQEQGVSGLQYELVLLKLPEGSNENEKIGTRFVGSSPSQAWGRAYRFLGRPGAVSGPHNFGLTNLKVHQLLVHRHPDGLKDKLAQKKVRTCRILKKGGLIACGHDEIITPFQRISREIYPRKLPQ